ncbi:unnamed protein product [Umbelopsis sp. WA50703]
MADPFTAAADPTILIALVLDDDPDYRNTRVDSGIPPPSEATIPQTGNRGQKRDRYAPQPDSLTTWNPKRQRNDAPYQRQEDPYARQERRGEQYQRYERRQDDRDPRDDPRYRPDQDRHRHEQEYRRHEDYRRHDPQYAQQERDFHRREQDYHRQPYAEPPQHSYDRPSHRSHAEPSNAGPPPEQSTGSEQLPPPPRSIAADSSMNTSSTRSQELPPPPKLITTDFKMNTDFLVCGEDDASVKLSNEEDIAKYLEIKHSQPDAAIDYEFVSSADLVQQVAEAKNRLTGTKHELFTLARSRTNPFDKIGQSIFISRAATKLAVLDVHFNLLATPEPNQTFQFADLCGGPGGFSGENDKEWRLDAFHPDADVKHSLTILDGVDHSGEIVLELYSDETHNDLTNLSYSVCPNGVDLVVADGGTNFQGQQDKQELIARQLLVCQTAAMFSVLRKVNEALAEEHAQSKRVNSIVERGKMESDEAFIDYMKMRNMKFAIKQLEALEYLEQFVQQPHNGATEPDQTEIRRRCLHEWRLPLQKESKVMEH